jgi:DNA repair protein RecO (recombination protein O)
MSEIIKTEAIVLSKLDYGDTSKIASLFTQDFGKISVIIKGARSAKSKIGKVVDPLNHIRIVFYNKESRDLQLISDAEIIDYLPALRDDLEKLKYSYSVLELINKLIPEHESNPKLFAAVVRILIRFSESNENPAITFGRFLLYFLKEVGFELQLEKCPVCEKEDFKKNGIFYSFDKGLICGKCKGEAVYNSEVKQELFSYLKCLKTNESAKLFNEDVYLSAIRLMEDHLKYHFVDFKGIKSLTMF